jgi:hypothetical protein
MHSNICTTKLIEKVKEGLSTGCVFNTATGSIVIVFFFCIHGKLISAGEAKTPRMEDGASLDASERIMWAPSCSSPVGLALCVSSELCICSK